MTTEQEKELLVSFTVLNKDYQNPSLRFVRGLQDASSTTPGTIDNPRNTGVPMRPDVVDPKICSFIYNGEARFLMAKVVTPVSGHDGQDTTFSMIAAPTPPYGCWSVLAKDITLQYPSRNGAPVATNPRGIAQTRGLLHIIDYDSTSIYTVGTDQLNGLTDYSRFTLTEKPFDVAAAIEAYIAGGGTAEPLPSGAKGQAIISIKNGNQRYLFALYIVSNPDPNNPQKLIYGASVLVRLKVSKDGVITYDTQTYVGENAVEIIPITGDNGDTYLLIPAMGGPQQAGITNEDASTVCRVPAFANTWDLDAPVALTGDALILGDFRAIAAPDRAKSAGVVYILIGYFNSNLYNGFNWTLFQSTVNKMISVNGKDISAAIADGTLTKVDWAGTIAPKASDPYGIYFWDILYETSTDAASDAKDRLHFFKGSALQITPAAAYPDPAPQTIQPPSDDPAPITGEGFILFPLGVRDGRMGGYNVDSADLTAETLRQYKAGVSLKRGAKATHITVSGE